MRSLMILILISGIMISCSNRKSNNEIKGKPIEPVVPVQVNWIGHWQNEGYKEQLLYDMARRFEFENQDIILNIKFPSEAFPEKTNNEFIYDEIRKTAPDWDIFRVNNEVSGIAILSGNPKWAAEHLVDFSQYEQFRNNSIETVISEETKDRWGGIVPGHALDAHSFVLWCNKEVADKIGIEIKQFDITAEDFESYLKALDTYNKKNNTNLYGISFNTGWLPSYSLGLQLFSSLIGDYQTLKNENYSDEKLKAWGQVLKYLEKLTAYNTINPNWENVTYSTDYASILNGECLFMINGTWMYNIFQSLDSVNYKKVIPLELPAFKPSQTYIGELSIPWAVPKKAKNKEEAIRFMLYWCRPDVADQWVRNTKSPSGIKGSLVQSEFGFDSYETFDYTIAKKYNGSKIPLNYSNNAIIFGNNNGALPSYFTEVISGAMTADAAMNQIKRRLRR